MLAGASLVSAGAAQAADLIVLAPDSAVISGTVAYDHVYIGPGATLRLAGDTAIISPDVYIAGGANLRTCFVAPSNDTGCTAGRSLTIQSSGEVVIGSGINLDAQSGTTRPAGSLNISGASVAISGAIEAAGSAGGTSGSVVINSPGAVTVSGAYYQPSINAPDGNIQIHGGSVSLTGDVDAAGTDTNFVNSGAVGIFSTAALSVLGNVNAYGHDSPAGSGAGVTLSGTVVRVGRIDASAGASSTAGPGNAGAVSVTGSSSVTITDYIDARGASGASTFASTSGGNVSISSGGPVLTGTIYTSGANADAAAPSGPGTITISGVGVATGQLFAVGGSRTGATGGPGAVGGVVSVSSTGPVSVDDVEANGGAAVGDGSLGGNGGAILLGGAGVYVSELRTTPGGSSGISSGASGGPITVTSSSALTILGGVYTNGAAASGGSSSPPTTGGSGASVILEANGPLALNAQIRTDGGNGGNAPTGVKAGAGGAAGSITIVGTPIDPIAGISAEGGDGGSSSATDLRGAGGAGGLVHVWSETNVFAGLRSISTAGGGGTPPGPDGAQQLESAPSGLAVDANGLISFTSNSPGAEGFRVLRSVAGAAATVVLVTASTSHLALPAADLCAPLTYQVVAFRSDVAWTSAPTAAVAYTRQPSAAQKCTDAPSLLHSKTVILSQKNLAKRKGALSFVVKTNGVGNVTATAMAKGVKKPLATAVVAAKKAGSLTIKLKLNLKGGLKYKLVKGRQIARVSVKLVAAAPTGSSTTSITVPVEVRK